MICLLLMRCPAVAASSLSKEHAPQEWQNERDSDSSENDDKSMYTPSIPQLSYWYDNTEPSSWEPEDKIISFSYLSTPTRDMQITRKQITLLANRYCSKNLIPKIITDLVENYLYDELNNMKLHYRYIIISNTAGNPSHPDEIKILMLLGKYYSGNKREYNKKVASFRSYRDRGQLWIFVSRELLFDEFYGNAVTPVNWEHAIRGCWNASMVNPKKTVCEYIHPVCNTGYHYLLNRPRYKIPNNTPFQIVSFETQKKLIIKLQRETYCSRDSFQ